uniref:Uncharacterized protein n=1 Tax=Arundo donax TaxID=35708 RepID=A0A0A9AIZ8_ARUDO
MLEGRKIQKNKKMYGSHLSSSSLTASPSSPVGWHRGILPCSCLLSLDLVGASDQLHAALLLLSPLTGALPSSSFLLTRIRHSRHPKLCP